MNLNHLKYFYDTARLKSLSEAAKVNFVGQSAISKAIRSLEDEFETELTLHKRNRFQLTEDGEVIYNQCLEVFRSIDLLKIKLDEERGLVKGELKVACASSMAREFLSSVIKRLNQNHPHLEIKLQLGRTDLVRNWVHSGSSDIGLILTHKRSTDFDYQVIAKGDFFLVKSPCYKGDWKKDGIFVTEETREVAILKEKLYRKLQIELPIQMEISSWGIIKNFVLDAHGIGLLPDYTIKKELSLKSLKTVSKHDLSIPYETLLITQSGRYLNTRMKAFISAIREEFKKT